jgi:hypothetical protein
LGGEDALGFEALGGSDRHRGDLRIVQPPGDPGERAGLRRGVVLPRSPRHPSPALHRRPQADPARGRTDAPRLRRRGGGDGPRGLGHVPASPARRGGLEAGRDLLRHLRRGLPQLHGGGPGPGPALG